MLYVGNPITNGLDRSEKMVCNNTNTTDGLSPQEKILLEDIQFYLTGVVLLVICILGILSNLVVMRVLLRRSMRSSTNIYLLSLAIFDIVILVCTILNLCLPALSPSYRKNVLPSYQLIAYPIALTAQTFVIWITICFTIERYIAVCHPLRAISLCTIKRARITIVAVVIISILYNLSRWFEYEYEKTDGTCAPKPRLIAVPVYEQLYSGMYFGLMLVLPVCLLAVFNTLLIIAVKKSTRQRKAMRVNDSKENNLTILLVIVVLVFIICQTPALIYKVAILLENRQLFRWRVFDDVRNFMVTLNSAINFVLYCALGAKFRKEFWLSVTEVCKCIKRQPQRTITHSVELTPTKKYTSGFNKYTQVSLVDTNYNEEAML